MALSATDCLQDRWLQPQTSTNYVGRFISLLAQLLAFLSLLASLPYDRRQEIRLSFSRPTENFNKCVFCIAGMNENAIYISSTTLTSYLSIYFVYFYSNFCLHFYSEMQMFAIEKILRHNFCSRITSSTFSRLAGKRIQVDWLAIIYR